jgi:hypothetical protein
MLLHTHHRQDANYRRFRSLEITTETIVFPQPSVHKRPFVSLFVLVDQVLPGIPDSLIDFFDSCINTFLQVRFSLKPKFLHGLILPQKLCNTG